MRHLSVLRYLEWTTYNAKHEHIAARELAELLWEHKTGLSRDPRNSIHHKGNLIRKWAKEYQITGKLSQSTQGTHQKNTAPLAQDHVAQEAQRELLRMAKPSPGALRKALMCKIFPRLEMDDSRISENTCRVYMEKWGWTMGSYRCWVPKNKSLKSIPIPIGSDSDEQNAQASDETAIAGDLSKSPETPCVKPLAYWPAPIPSPKSAILSTVDPHDMFSSKESFTGASNGPILYTHSQDAAHSPGFFRDSTLPMRMHVAEREAHMWPAAFPGYPSTYASYTPPPIDSNFVANPYDHPHKTQSIIPTQPVAGYVPKSLENLVAPLPQMMGHKPVFNGATTTFIADPTTFEGFAHDATFSGRPNLIGTSSEFRPSSNYSYPLHPQYMLDSNGSNHA
jgi:hypothetical protein